ncbi:MAG: hydroxyacid dehydrogenase [Puniceicoccales bacterium]
MIPKHKQSSQDLAQSVPQTDPCEVLFLIDTYEADQFFGPQKLSDYLSEHPAYQWVETSPDLDVELLLRELHPEVIVGAWSTPPLPFIDGKLPAPYYCHICGSVKKQITREHLEAGIRVTNWGNSVAMAVAETALMLTLAALRNVGYHLDNLHYKNRWLGEDTPPQKSLVESKVGIHGLGNIGRALISLLKPFHADIAVYDPYVNPNLFAEYEVQRAESLEELFGRSEVLFECCALTPETKGIVSRSLLQSMPADSTFVNVGRGHLVDESALAEIVKSGHLRAGLDVYQKEPLPPESVLRGLRGLIAMPHLGGNNQKTRRNAGQKALANVEAFLAGKELTNEIRIEQYELMT